MNSTLSTFNTMTEVPLSKAPNLQCSGCVFTVCVCSLLTAVCVHMDGLNAEDQFRVWVTILDNTSHFLFFFLISGSQSLKHRLCFSDPCQFRHSRYFTKILLE